MSERVAVKFGRQLAHSMLFCVLLGAVACAASPSHANGSPAGRQTSPQPGHGQTRGECFSVPSRILQRAIPYCVVLPPSYDAQKTRRYPVLYYLHGLGDSQQMLLRSGGFTLLEDLWDEKRLGEFVIATPAAGSSFYVDSRDGRNPYEEFFVQEFLPYIEHRYRIEPGRAFRGIGGISMGGYGALHLAFRHPDLFSSVSGISAALIEKPPAIAVDNSVEAGPLRLFGDVFGAPFDRAFWDRNNPLMLARTADLSQLKIYFDCGTEDDYGFNAGAQALHDLLASRHVAHEFHLDPGGHTWDYFAAHLPASMEFHSHAFGAGPLNTPRNR